MKAKTNSMACLGKRIKQAREQAGITQEELAGSIGISRAAIARYELGEIEPKIRNLVLLAEHLNVSTDYLLGVNSTEQSDVLDLSYDAVIALKKLIEELRK